ncbi:MAG: endonuclease [Lachnospiraceae bacterium]|nr:endonuclease [Lachnospiraceae bacterium]
MFSYKSSYGIVEKLKKVFLPVFMAGALLAGSVTGYNVPEVTRIYAVTQPNELSYNPGHRDTVCTELSEAAVAYYSGEYSIGSLSKLTGDLLKSALHDLMTDTDKYSNKVSYSMLTKYFPYVDAEDGKAGTVLFYSDALPVEATDTQKATIISREHVWPKSHASFHENFGGSDLHHLRPTDSIVNANRSSYCFGSVDKTDKNTRIDRLGDKNSGKIAGWWNVEADRFEPLDNVKGDIARILLYVYVRWEEPNLVKDVEISVIDESQGQKNNNDGKKVIESLDTLFTWMELDPVDTWEMGRNDLVQQVQGNRNVFIDHPELAYAMFERTTPGDVEIGKAQQKEYNDPNAKSGQEDKNSDKNDNKNADKDSSDTATDTTPAPHANITKKTLKVGQNPFKIKISYLAKDAVVKYKSSSKSVARVTKTGKIKAVSEGSATITVTIKQNGKTYKSKIAVKVTAPKEFQ